MIRSWIKVIYKDINSCVINNGWASEFFSINRGVRQGCPLSAYLFIISVELMAENIRQDAEIVGITVNDIEYKISMYADDTMLFLTGGVASIQAALCKFKMFQYISGLKVNIEKTHIMPFGEHEVDKEEICDLGINWTLGPICILGINIENTFTQLFELNYLAKKKYVTELCALWSKRNMTPMGHNVILKSHILSQYVYLNSNLPSPPKMFLEEFQKSLFNFIWSGKIDKIKRSYLYADKCEGGLNVPHLLSQDQTMTISWLHRLLKRPKNDKLFHMVNFLFKGKFEYLLSCNFCKKDCLQINRELPIFWQHVLEAWANFNFYEPVTIENVLSQSIWNNSFIRINDNVVFYEMWFNKVIKYIHHLTKFESDRYKILTIEEINNIYNCNSSKFSYMSVIDAIPPVWRKKINFEVVLPKPNPSSYKIEKLIKMTKISNFVNFQLKQKICQEPLTAVCSWNKEGFDLDLDTFYICFNTIYRDLISVKTRMFHFKFLHRKLALNPWLYKCGIKTDEKCTLCGSDTETMVHLFCNCIKVSVLWEKIKIDLFDNNEDILPFFDNYNIMFNICKDKCINKITILAKYYIYISRCNGDYITYNAFFSYLKQSYCIEKRIALNKGKLSVHNNIWSNIIHKF